MPRYFIELAYKGSNYSGFQKQNNAITIQYEVERAMKVYFQTEVNLTGSSRTDAGVHAFQNFFHLDLVKIFSAEELDKASYHLNAILPADIVIKRIFLVGEEAHCRFDAISRSYIYTIYRVKNPFIYDRAYFYPYPLDIDLLNQAAHLLTLYNDFQSFSKKNTQVYTFNCTLINSKWNNNSDNTLIYQVTGNRFLRGMVRGLVGTMLKVGREKITLEQFKLIIESKDQSQTDFATPAHGLTLASVNF